MSTAAVIGAAVVLTPPGTVLAQQPSEPAMQQRMEPVAPPRCFWRNNLQYCYLPRPTVPSGPPQPPRPPSAPPMVGPPPTPYCPGCNG